MTDTALIQSLIAGVDHAAQQAEAKWGVGRLENLVSDDIRAKFIRQHQRWRVSLEAAWDAPILPKPVEDALRAASGGMQRAWAALDAEATAGGHTMLSPLVWETSLKDGTVVAIVRTTAEAIAVARDGRHVDVFSLAEIANLIDALRSLKAAPEPIRSYDGVKVRNGRGDYSWVAQGDPLPF